VNVRLVVRLPDEYGCPLVLPVERFAVNVTMPLARLTACGMNACFWCESAKNWTPHGASVFHFPVSSELAVNSSLKISR